MRHHPATARAAEPFLPDLRPTGGPLCLFALLIAPPSWGLPPPAPARTMLNTAGGAESRAASAQVLTLQEAIETALRQHPQVVAAHYTQVLAQTGIGSAVSAWLPQLTSTAQLRGDLSTPLGGTSSSATAGGSSAPSTNMRALYGSQLQLTQLLYDFGRTGGAIASNRAAARAARGDEMATRAQVALAALTAYYAVLQAEALAEVADSTLAQQQQRLRQAESFFATGTRAEIDVLIARTAVAQAELQRVQAHNSIVVTRAQLLLALGVTDAGWLTRPLRAEPLPALPAESRPLAELVDEALAQRPDFLALRERVIQAQEQIRVSRGAYFPILQLSATAGINGTAFGSSSSGATSSSGVSTAAPGLGVTGIVGLSWPLFSGMATLYDVRASRARWEVARANLETLRQQVRSQLQQGLLDLRTARQSAVAATVVVKQAEKQLEMASVRYRTGLGNAIELGDAQVTATTARAQRVQSEYALALSRANLQWQLGALHSASGQLP